jgi:simple sugar transport system permease protein
VSVIAIVTDSSLMSLRKAPLVTAMAIAGLCLFLTFIMKTKLGQDFRSVGHSQHIAEVSGINVDRTRIIATIFSTVFAAWGMIIYMQNMGTLATYDSHRNIGLFSVAALLVGGASTSRASVKNALAGAALFNAMTIISPELGIKLFGDPGSGEYFRSFMVYGVIGLALGLYVWKTLKASRSQNAL